MSEHSTSCLRQLEQQWVRLCRSITASFLPRLYFQWCMFMSVVLRFRSWGTSAVISDRDAPVRSP